MADEVKNETSVQEQDNQVPVQNPFGDESWVEQPVKSEAPAQTEQVKTDVPQETKNEETTVEPFYKKLGFEKEDDVVNEITTLREKASKTTDELKFEDEQSKQIHELLRTGKKKEVLEFLATQEKLETLVAAEVNEDTAGEIIKLGLKLKHKDLTDKEIEHKYNKQYSLPKEPVKGELDDDDEFAEKHAEWKERVDAIKMDKIIEAKTMKPELQKANTELVLPEIQKENRSQKEPTPEEQESFRKDKETFLQSAQSVINGYTGISVPVKDKDVDYTVNYSPSQEEKTIITEKLSEFAESGFDVNMLFAERWVSEDGKSIKVEQMVKDLSLLYGQEKFSQKLATDSANKRLEAYLKDKKQINVNETNPNGQLSLEKDNTSETAKLQEFFWNQS